jgi:hypothetical protein
MAHRSAPNRRGERSDGSPGVARIVTCTGNRGAILGRVTCGIEGRLRGSPRRFRPAPLRAPPHVLAAAIGSGSCRARPHLIPRMCRFRRASRRVAWRLHLNRRMSGVKQMSGVKRMSGVTPLGTRTDSRERVRPGGCDERSESWARPGVIKRGLPCGGRSRPGRLRRSASRAPRGRR